MTAFKQLSGNKRDAGFSLVEMLVVLAILGLATSLLSSFQVNRDHQNNARQLARDIRGIFEVSRLSAIERGVTGLVTVDLEQRTVESSAKRAPFVKIGDRMDVELRTGIGLVESADRGSIVFYSDGTASGGAIRIADPAGREYEVSVHWLTGVIRIRQPRYGG